MRFYQQQHVFYCGVDLHARTLYLCIVSQAGDKVLHKRDDFWDAGLAPGNRRAGDGWATEPDKRFAAAHCLQPHREVLAAAVWNVKLATN